MKRSTRLIALLLLISSGLSCTNDSAGPQPVVDYRVTASSDMMVNVWFRNDKGKMTQVFVPDGETDWNMKIPVDRPFDASLSAGFYNTRLTTETCAVEIYVDDVLIETYPGSLPPSQSYTLYTHYQIPK